MWPLDASAMALSISFGYETVDNWLEVALPTKPGHICGRNSNPTVAFEDKVRNLESAEAATSFASKMAVFDLPGVPGLAFRGVHTRSQECRAESFVAQDSLKPGCDVVLLRVHRKDLAAAVPRIVLS